MAAAASRSGIDDWGTPDPRDAGAYPEPTSATPMTTWAWEFLRRSEDYRRRWLQLNNRGLKEVTETERGRVTHWRSAADVLREEFRICARTPGDNSTLDPRSAEPPLFEGAGILIEVEVQPHPVKPPEILIKFDWSLPHEPQLENVRRLLHERAKTLPLWRRVRPQIDKLPRYLRLLDFGEGASDEEVGKFLFPHLSGEQLRVTIRDTFDQARRWQGDYLILALHSSTAS